MLTRIFNRLIQKHFIKKNLRAFVKDGIIEPNWKVTYDKANQRFEISAVPIKKADVNISEDNFYMS